MRDLGKAVVEPAVRFVWSGETRAAMSEKSASRGEM